MYYSSWKGYQPKWTYVQFWTGMDLVISVSNLGAGSALDTLRIFKYDQNLWYHRPLKSTILALYQNHRKLQYTSAIRKNSGLVKTVRCLPHPCLWIALFLFRFRIQTLRSPKFKASQISDNRRINHKTPPLSYEKWGLDSVHGTLAVKG